MKKFENDHNKIIRTIRDTEPMLHNPAEMTEGIIRRVNDLTEFHANERVNKIIITLRPIMAAAASLLIGLFVYQNLNNSNEGNNRPGSTLYAEIINSESSRIESSNNAHDAVIDKIAQCSDTTEGSFNQLNRDCLIALASEYYEKRDVNKKQKLLSWYKQTHNAKAP
jgi:hypothetical protein